MQVPTFGNVFLVSAMTSVVLLIEIAVFVVWGLI